MATVNRPCSACKFLNRECRVYCEFAPHFPADDPHKFMNAYKMFGTAIIARHLWQVGIENRQEVADSLAYDAEARLRDPVNGSPGIILMLEKRYKQIEDDVFKVKRELYKYMGNSVFRSFLHISPFSAGGSSLPRAPSNMPLMNMSFPVMPTGGALVKRKPAPPKSYMEHLLSLMAAGNQRQPLQAMDVFVDPSVLPPPSKLVFVNPPMLPSPSKQAHNE